jgi:hypothetical protein
MAYNGPRQVQHRCHATPEQPELDRSHRATHPHELPPRYPAVENPPAGRGSNAPRTSSIVNALAVIVRDLRPSYAESLIRAPNEDFRLIMPFSTSKMLTNRTESEWPSFFVT